MPSEPIRAHLVPIRDLTPGPGMRVADLVRGLHEGGGFSAKKVQTAAEILRRMGEEGCTMILSMPAAPMATGVRGVVREMVKSGIVDAILTTCGFLDHDLARVWRDYYQGSFDLDDVELHRENVHRLGSVLVPAESYGEILEEKLQPWLAQMHAQKRSWSTRDLAAEFGRRLEGEPNAESSVLYWASRRGVPVFVPGPTDGAVGSQIWLYYQKHRDFQIDLLADEQALSDLVFGARELGALMIGGGISKHHAIWWAQFRDGLDHGVYITTAPEWDGSLSGARLEEAISWGKLKETAKFVNLEGDATLLLPLVYAATLG